MSSREVDELIAFRSGNSTINVAKRPHEPPPMHMHGRDRQRDKVISDLQ